MSWNSTTPVDSTLIADVPSSIRSVQAAILADSTMSASDSLTPVTEKAITQYVTGTAITMSNKTISSPILITPQIDDVDSGHQYIVGVANLSADKSTAYPLLSADDTFVFDNHAATLKNKTISTPVIEGTISTISIISATASTDNDVANKKYVDDNVPTGLLGANESNGETAIGELEIKWGDKSLAASSGTTITFTTEGLTAFSTSCFQVFACHAGVGDPITNPLEVQNVTKDNFTVQNGDTVTVAVRWFAIGR